MIATKTVKGEKAHPVSEPPEPSAQIPVDSSPVESDGHHTVVTSVLLSSEEPVPAETAAPQKAGRTIPGFLLLPLIGLLLLALNVPQVFPLAGSFLHIQGTRLLTQLGLAEPETLSVRNSNNAEPDRIDNLTTPDTTIHENTDSDTARSSAALPDFIPSTQAILIDLTSGDILAERDAETPIYPASMTKVMTLLVAAEQIQNLDDTFTITQDILNTALLNDLVPVGFLNDETVSVRDLLYGLILRSGADATYGITTYVSGSERTFTEQMNAKAARLGLDSVHFENATGFFEETHRCSVHDMAVILWFAMQNDLCREVLTSVTYTTTQTEQHPEGLVLTNEFLVQIAQRDCGTLQVIAAKTGFVDEAGHCAASYAVDETGHAYICVTANADSYEQVATDHAAIYANFVSSIETQAA